MRKKILIASCYNAYGGSTFTLLKMYEALKDNFEVIFRSPIKEADSKLNISYPTYTLDTVLKKIKVIKIFLYFIWSEFNYLKRNKFDLILVNDNLSILTYGVVAKILGIKILWRVELSEGKGILKLIKNFFVYKKIYISKFMIPSNEKNPIIIRNPISVKKYKKVDKKDSLIKIFLIGSICDRKNQIFALKAFSKLIKINKNYRLYFVGNILDEDYFNKVLNYIRENNLNDYVFYEGFKSQEEIYSNVDIILITSKFESFGLTLLEGLYNRIPVIAPNIESFNEITELIGYRYLYSKNNLESCINKILNLTNLKIDFSDEIDENFSFEIFSKSLINIMEKEINE